MNGVEGDQLTIYTDIYMKGIISDYRLASLTWDGEVYTIGSVVKFQSILTMHWAFLRASVLVKGLEKLWAHFGEENVRVCNI